MQRDVLVDQLVSSKKIIGSPVAGKVGHHAHGRGGRGVYAPGHLGELTRIVDFVLVATVIEPIGSRDRWLGDDDARSGAVLSFRHHDGWPVIPGD